MITPSKSWIFNFFGILPKIGNLNILLAIEKELDIKFKTKEFNSLINFRNILKNVKSKIKKWSRKINN